MTITFLCALYCCVLKHNVKYNLVINYNPVIGNKNLVHTYNIDIYTSPILAGLVIAEAIKLYGIIVKKITI